MSSYEPPEEENHETSHDPGIKEREILEKRNFSAAMTEFDRVDFIVLGVLLSIPTAFLTIILVIAIFPGFQDTAGEIVRGISSAYPTP